MILEEEVLSLVGSKEEKHLMIFLGLEWTDLKFQASTMFEIVEIEVTR